MCFQMLWLLLLDTLQFRYLLYGGLRLILLWLYNILHCNICRFVTTVLFIHRCTVLQTTIFLYCMLFQWTQMNPMNPNRSCSYLVIILWYKTLWTYLNRLLSPPRPSIALQCRIVAYNTNHFISWPSSLSTGPRSILRSAWGEYSDRSLGTQIPKVEKTP